MNIAQSNQEKRSIRVKEFLEDFRSGLTDDELMEKYRLTAVGLEKFYQMLMERDILDPTDFERYRGEDDIYEDLADSDAARSARVLCPSCLVTHEDIFERCPNCGANMREFLADDLWDDLPAGAEKAVEIKDRAMADPVAENSNPQEPKEALASNGTTGSDPIEIPLHEALADTPLPQSKVLEGGKRWPDIPEFEKISSVYDDTEDEVFPGMPLGFVGGSPDSKPERNPLCEECREELEPMVRDVYDRRSGLFALAISGAFLILGFLGAVALTFITGYSAGRLVLVYMTGIAVLLGCTVGALALFMLVFAKEKAYLCFSCRRVYPRA